MIQIIEGPSGSGKSHFVYEELIHASMETPEQKFFLIVPEQFTMQAQRDIVTLHPRHGTMNIDIVSFNRLAYRVFEELNVQRDYVLEDFGKSMLLQKILMQYRNELPIFGVSYNKMGFLDELKSLLTELFQYRIGREDIQELYNTEELPVMLRQKLHDLLTVYDAFQREVQGNYIIAEHILEILAGIIPQSELLAGSVIYLDGFTGFTPIQYEVLEGLMQVSAALKVTVTLDAASAKQETCKPHELFYLSKDTIKRILSGAERLGIYAEEYFMQTEGIRYVDEEMKHLERNLFRYPYQVWKQEVKGIHIQAMRNPRQELHEVARQIHELVRKQGYRYQDIAVIHGDLESIDAITAEIFPKLDIPYFIDANHNIYMNPCLECIRAVLEIAERNYSYESVFRFLKTGVTGLETEALELLENYVLQRGIRGYAWWKKVFDVSDEELAGLDTKQYTILETGRQVLQILENVISQLQKAETVSEYVDAMCEFLKQLQMQEQLEQAADNFEETGDYVQAKAFRQIYEHLDEIWEKMTSILGTAQMQPEEFHQLLESGLDEIALGVIPPSLDQVTVGDIERTRLNHIKVLFVVGVNDGIIPRMTRAGGILSEADRGQLEQRLELAPDSRTRVFTEQFYLYQNLTKASEQLYLTYHVQDSDGNEVLPAYLIGRIQRLFEQLPVQEFMRIELQMEQIETAEDSIALLAEGLQTDRKLTKEERELWKSLYDYYEAEQETVINQVKQGLFYYNQEAALSPEIAARLYGTILNTSISRLETYSRCPYQFFLEYGLKLKKRDTREITLGDMGNLLHHIVERVFSKVEQRNAEDILVSEDTENCWTQISDEELTTLVEQEIHQAVEQEQDSIYKDSYTNRQLLRRIQMTAAYAVVDLKNQLLQGKMIPYRFEMTFNRSYADPICRDLHSADLVLEDGSHMKLSGVVDRMDICQDEEHVYVKVLDYKSSGKEIDVTKVSVGLQLQLLIYTNVVLEVLQREFPNKKIIPAGSLYYGFRVPMVEKTSKKLTEALQHKIQRETAMTGVVNKEEPSISYLGDIETLPVKQKKTEEGTEIEESDTVLTESNYRQLLEEVTRTAAQIGSDMKRGDIPIQPVRTGRSVPCDYCAYREVCKLDCVDGGNQIYTVQQLKHSRKGESRHEMDKGTAEGH